jgi:alkaline phosphatase
VIAYRIMMKKINLFTALLCALVIVTTPSFSQEAKDSIKTYPGGEAHSVKTYPHDFTCDRPKNVILFIGDGMGVAQVYAGLTANKGNLFLENFKHIGFTKTYSANRYITDSAAAATAIATGQKTDNGVIGMDPDQQSVKNITESASKRGIAAGIVATSSITHATPGAFVAHQRNRSQEEEIALDFLASGIDVFIGGGVDFFTKREDGRDLINEFTRQGYAVKQDLEEIRSFEGSKLLGLTAPRANGRLSDRGDMLPISTETAINVLKQNEKGFFLMVEGSFIDSGGHANNTIQIVEEVLDLDRTIGKALDFAAKDGQTLIVVASDHETGGMTINGGSFESGMVKGEFTTGGHTGVMTPIFAYGPGASEFGGIMENTDIHAKIYKLLFGEK